jgi:hypothetical protein
MPAIRPRRPALAATVLLAVFLACDTPVRPGPRELDAPETALPGPSTVVARADTAPNPVRTENAKAGTAAWRLVNPASGGEIEGYASATSVNRGGTIDLFVNTLDPSYGVTIYRVGWYGGLGGREVYVRLGIPGVRQPAPTVDPVTHLVEARWTTPVRVLVPASPDPTDWASGVYLAKLTGSSGKESYIVFAVRDDARPSHLLFQMSVTTYQAYNTWGGYSLYTSTPARKVSFNRPYTFHGTGASGAGAGEFLTNLTSADFPVSRAAWEVNMVRWLEREGYDVTYATNLDTHQNPSLLSNRKGFLSVGHDEYWSSAMRTHVEQARDRGVGLGFFSANSAYWQVRFEPGADGQPDRTMVAYKSAALTADPYALDRDTGNDRYITTRFRDAPVNRPEAALLGTQYVDDGVRDQDIVVADATQWPFANTGLANGSKLVGLLGYEVDARAASTPPGTVLLARSPFTTAWRTSGVSDMTTYRAASGATVFATGSIQWAWGLDDYNALEHRPPLLSAAAQQVTRNVLDRLINPPLDPPTAPTGLTATAGTSISLAWLDNATTETGYEVERAISTGSFTLLARLGANARSYTDASVTRRTSHKYRVRAYNAGGVSAYSNTVTVKSK